MNNIIEANKRLCEKYPFLIPRNRFSGEIVEDYDYSYTELDDLGEVWKNAFGYKLVEEINEALGEYNKNYRIMQIKEKYGELRWYDSGWGIPGGIYDKIFKITMKYTNISKRICAKCGKSTHYMTMGWIQAICKDCAKEKYKELYDLDTEEIIKI